MTEPDERRARIRKSTITFSLIALAFYLAFILVGVVKA